MADPEERADGAQARARARARARGPRFAMGAALVAVGIVWVGQGVGLIGGSFMTGQAFWAVMGAVCLVAGIATLVRLRAAS